MKKLFIIANWKSNKTASEAHEWLQNLSDFQFPSIEEKIVIVCPSFTSLSVLKNFIIEKNLPIFVGSQDISPFTPGAYTGEMNANQIKEFVSYTIIGHSERRNYFKEDDALLAKKVQIALAGGLQPVFCIQGKDTPIPEGVQIVAYEPLSAIGTGHPDTPEDAENVAHTVKGGHPGISVLYGGSVTPDEVHSFTQLPSIDGVLVGGASLDAEKFTQLISNA
ncbi:MAG: triose-phosphate isomerase family protein [Candidatus Levyibacteriota bacterium]